MASDTGKLAQRYAKALLRAVGTEARDTQYDTAQQDTGAEGPTPAQQLGAQLREFARLWESHPELAASMLNPMFNKTQRLAALKQVTRQESLPELAQRFLEVVFERDRIGALPEMVRSFIEQADAAAGVVQVEVKTARAIDEDETRSIEASLAQHISGNLEFTWSVDPALIGGMIVSYAGRVIDGSLSGRLERIERKLMG